MINRASRKPSHNEKGMSGAETGRAYCISTAVNGWLTGSQPFFQIAVTPYGVLACEMRPLVNEDALD